MKAAGTEGYDVAAADLIHRYELIPPNDKYSTVLELLPTAPAVVMDVGSGSGVDAAWFAEQGHHVFAVEPVDELRMAAMSIHRSPRIHWIEDCLPALASVARVHSQFDLIVVAGVWTHLDAGERDNGMRTLSALLSPHGVLIMSLRHGPGTTGRRFFPVSVESTVTTAMQYGLQARLERRVESLQIGNQRAGVTWTWLAFRPVRGQAPAGAENRMKVAPHRK